VCVCVCVCVRACVHACVHVCVNISMTSTILCSLYSLKSLPHFVGIVTEVTINSLAVTFEPSVDTILPIVLSQ